jgi:ATP-dependent Clp protease adaptor protein ClpS
VIAFFHECAAILGEAGGQEGLSAVSDIEIERGSTSTVDAPAREKETQGEDELDVPWQVIVHNDPVNLMTYVTMVFQRVFGYPREKAERHMLEVHQKGRSIVWCGMRERAEFYVQQLHGYLLLATLEKVV